MHKKMFDLTALGRLDGLLLQSGLGAVHTRRIYWLVLLSSPGVTFFLVKSKSLPVNCL